VPDRGEKIELASWWESQNRPHERGIPSEIPRTTYNKKKQKAAIGTKVGKLTSSAPETRKVWGPKYQRQDGKGLGCLKV